MSGPALVLARGLVGFVLGACLAVFLLPLGLAMALLIGGILLWARLRGLDAGPLPAIGGGFVLAVAAYLALAVVAAAS